MKAFTDLEQSKKLAEILPLDSADFHFSANLSPKGYLEKPICGNPEDANYSAFPCWSLATLIDVLPADLWGYNDHYFLEISKMGDASKPNKVCYYRYRKEIDGANYDRISHISHSAENIIDACVNMIITLHEHKLLKKH